MKTKRVYYPIDKKAIQEAIDLYNEHNERESTLSHEESMVLWEKYCDKFNEISPGSNTWVASIFQAMSWSGTLDVEHVYYAILAMGINTKLEECDD